MTATQFRNSAFDRNKDDRYFTETWVTKALLRRIDMCPSYAPGITIWEPACGRGDMAMVFENQGYEVLCSDIDPWGAAGYVQGSLIELNFLETLPPWRGRFQAIITNPPYGGERKKSLAEMFVRRALEYPEADIIAMLLRAEFSYADGRTDLFDRPPFAFEIRLTNRPRWDWWLPEDEQGEHGGFHNYSWFVWDRAWTAAPTIVFENKVPAEERAAKRLRKSKGKSLIEADAELDRLLQGLDDSVLTHSIKTDLEAGEIDTLLANL